MLLVSHIGISHNGFPHCNTAPAIAGFTIVVGNYVTHISATGHLCDVKESEYKFLDPEADLITPKSNWSTISWLMPYRSQWNIVHKPLISISLSCAAASIFPPAVVEVRSPHFLFQYCPPSVLWPHSSSMAHCNTCFAMLSSLLLRLCPRQFHFLLLSWDSTCSWSVFLQNSLLVLSGQCTFTALRKRLLIIFCLWLRYSPRLAMHGERLLSQRSWISLLCLRKTS